MLTADWIHTHYGLKQCVPSVHYISIKEKSTISPLMEQSINFPSYCVIPDVYLKVNPISRGNCECGTLLKGYKAFSWVGVIVVTRPNRALLRCIWNVTIMSLCCLTAVNGKTQRGHNGEFHPLSGEGWAKTCAPLSRQSRARLTDNWYLGFKRNENESKSRAS